MSRSVAVLAGLVCLSGTLLIGVVSPGGTAHGQVEVHFKGTVNTIGEWPGPLPEPVPWWNVQVEEVISGPSMEPTVDVYYLYVEDCVGSIEVPHDSTAVGKRVEVVGYYDQLHTVRVCEADHSIRFEGATPEATPESTPFATPEASPTPGGQETLPLVVGCNPMVWTGPDDTPIATVAGAVSPPGALVALWEFEAGVWLGHSPQYPAVSDLTAVHRLGVTFVCVDGPGAFTRPTI